MADWKFLFELLHNEDMDSHDIVNALGVKPSRLQQMLRSKRLAARLASIEAIADKKAGHAIVSSIAPAMHKMAELIDSKRPETARKACLDMLEAAREVFKRKGLGSRS